MTLDQLFDLARASDIEYDGNVFFSRSLEEDVTLRDLLYFARLVAETEREACAKLVDHVYKQGGGTYAELIRARGKA